MYTPALPDVDWSDWNYLLILSDAEEEAGNLLAAQALRWIV